MKTTKSLGNKLIAAFLSMAMMLTAILPNTTVYAAENVLESESEAALPESELNDETSDEYASAGDILDEGTSDDEVLSEADSTGEESKEVVSEDEMQNGEISDAASDDVVPDSDVIGETYEDEAVYTVSATEFSKVGGWNESIYAEIAGVADADVTEVSYSGPVSDKLKGDDFTYLVRDIANNKNQSTNEGVRIDIPGLKPGTYTLTVKVGGNTITKSGIEVTAYDRSGYAHFNYEGVGAYNDDGTLKDNAIVLYVTDDNKNTVVLKSGSTTVTGIGNILNSAGGSSSSGSLTNGNNNIIRRLADAGTPLVIRFIGTVSDSNLYERNTFSAKSKSEINGLTAYSSKDYGGSIGDNGHLARIQSGKDITLEGIGYDATIDGWGFHYITQSSYKNYGKSFEVRNLTFINTPEDAVGMEGQQEDSNSTSSKLSAPVERCWVHHNTFYCPSISDPAENDKSEGDGSVDFKKGQYFTCSYNYFEGCHKTHLVGGGDTHLQFNLTYHHNHWYMCDQRGPLTRNANVHMYNNFVDMQRFYAQNTRADAYIFSEYNLFYASMNPQKVKEGAIKSFKDSYSSIMWTVYAEGEPGTIVTNKAQYVTNNCQYIAEGIQYNRFETDAKLSYIPGNDYEIQTDFTKLQEVIASQTGAQSEFPKTITTVTENDYSVIERNGATINTIGTLPDTISSPKTSNNVYAFKVNESFNLEIEYADADNVGILVNAAGENLLEGNGSVNNLPAGTYMIQSVGFTAAKYSGNKGTPAEFNDIAIKSMKFTAGVKDVISHSLIFDSNGGSPVDSVAIYSNQKYEISQMSARDGYTFVGWYDELEGGKLVTVIDGSTMTGDVTVYAHWNKQGTQYTLSLDCSKDLDEYVDKDNNITSLTTVNGFTIHALPDGKDWDDDKKEYATKYYMTLKPDPKVLGTNGLRITDKTVSGNEDGLLKSIEFTTKGSGMLAVETALSGGPKGDGTGKYYIVLSRKISDSSLEEVGRYTIEDNKASATTKRTAQFEFDQAGTYYLYPEGDKGVVYYTLNVKGVEDEDAKQPVNYTVKFDAGDGTLAEDVENPVTASEGASINLPLCTPPEGKTFSGWSVGNSSNVLTGSYTVNASDADENNIITLNATYIPDGSQDGDKDFEYSVTFTYDPVGTVKTISFKDDKYNLENNVISVSERTELLFKPEPADGYKITSVKTGGTNGEDLTVNPEGYYAVTIISNTEVIITTAKIDGGSHNDPDSQSGIRIEGLEGPFYYTGAKIIPDITVKDYGVKGDDGEYGKILAPGVDYTVKYSNNVKSSTDPTNKTKKAKVTVTGKGNYTGKDADEEFEITDFDNFNGDTTGLADLKGAKIAKIDPEIYNGKPHNPDFTITFKNKTTATYTYTGTAYEIKSEEGAEPTDLNVNIAVSNNINKGTATILVTGAKGSNGKVTTVKKTFKITAVDISNAQIGPDDISGTYAVKGAAPDELKVTIKLGDSEDEETVTLRKNIDYTVKFSSNKKAGTPGKIVITGKGNYAKKLTGKTFTVNPLDLTGRDISAVVAYDGLKVSKIKATILDDQNNALKASQYTLKVYKDEACQEEYTAAKLTSAEPDNIIYVRAEARDNTNLKNATKPLEVKVGKNIAQAKISIVKVGKKTKTYSYTGDKIELEDADLVVTIKENGTPKTLHMKDSDNDNECYEIVGYMNNVNKGTATAIIQGTGEYSGTKTVKFKIVGKTMAIDTTS
ncbi:MAG: InlB B-repeat-containing protein [Lachnospiraceae bacterium]|nr:InlB B-repeat-containing protein [Lachnospiraceae bacterium]